jgi:phosphoheptose isomerase
MSAGTAFSIGDVGMPQASLTDVEHVILDRDGVLNEEMPDGGYVRTPTDFRWIPGALGALATLRASGVRVTIATNQSGVGRGLMSALELEAVHEQMTRDAARAGGSIDAIYHCPHAPDARCGCRKPLPGLIETAITASDIARERTLVVGDAARDIEAAEAAGTRSILLRTGQGKDHEPFAKAHGIPTCEDLRELAQTLTQERRPKTLELDALRRGFDEHVAVVQETVHALLPRVAMCIEVVRRCLDQGGKVLACGNGGSAADAQHFVAELVGRFNASRRALPAVCVMGDPASFTAISNDFGFEQVFARHIEALARPGDVLIAISTSGNSPNVLRAADVAQTLGCTVIGLTGRSGGLLARRASVTLNIPSDTVARIQEVHGICLHQIAAGVDVSARHSSLP